MRAPLYFAGLLLGLAAADRPLAAAVRGIPPMPSNELSESFSVGTPESEGLDSAKLAELTDWIREKKLPIFSLLISRDGKLVYELYTSSIERDEAHYIMSATKSFTSALVGAAIDRKLIAGWETPVSEALPKSLFPSDEAVKKFSTVTVQDVLGMSALDALNYPHADTAGARQLQKDLFDAKNRVAFALKQPLLPEPGKNYQYNDITPLLATGMISYSANKTELQFAQEVLFKPLGFRNEEWMHQDPSGIDNGAYGLRIRPIDMQKFGILYLRGGTWNGKQLLAKNWTERSYRPWIKTKEQNRQPNYGWYWWQSTFAPDWIAHEAIGWKGQRISVISRQGMVVTLTSDVEDDSENEMFGDLMRNFIIPAAHLAKGSKQDFKTAQRLADALSKAHDAKLIPEKIEKRMVPSIGPKETHRNLAPLADKADAGQ